MTMAIPIRSNTTNRIARCSLRTFSKLYLAGLRVGYGVAPKELIAMMQRVRQPFNVAGAVGGLGGA